MKGYREQVYYASLAQFSWYVLGFITLDIVLILALCKFMPKIELTTCGETISFQKARIISPVRVHPISARLDCSLTIDAGEHNKVRLDFLQFNVAKNSFGRERCKDQLLLYDDNDDNDATTDKQSVEYCGSFERNEVSVTSRGQRLTLKYVDSGEGLSSFELEYHVVPNKSAKGFTSQCSERNNYCGQSDLSKSSPQEEAEFIDDRDGPKAYVFFARADDVDDSRSTDEGVDPVVMFELLINLVPYLGAWGLFFVVLICSLAIKDDVLRDRFDRFDTRSDGSSKQHWFEFNVELQWVTRELGMYYVKCMMWILLSVISFSLALTISHRFGKITVDTSDSIITFSRCSMATLLLLLSVMHVNLWFRNYHTLRFVVYEIVQAGYLVCILFLVNFKTTVVTMGGYQPHFAAHLAAVIALVAAVQITLSIIVYHFSGLLPIYGAVCRRCFSYRVGLLDMIRLGFGGRPHMCLTRPASRVQFRVADVQHEHAGESHPIAGGSSGAVASVLQN